VAVEQSGKREELRLVLTPKNVQANRSLPEFLSASQNLLLSDDPSDDDIGKVRLFPQRIVPVEKLSSRSGVSGLFSGKKPAAAKESNTEVAGTLKVLQQSSNPLDTSQIESFLKAHPQSRWAPALRHELARRQFRRGLFAQAVEGWDALWDELKDRQDSGAVEVANQVTSQLLDTYIGLGKAERLAALIGEQESRPGNPVIQAKSLRAKQAIWLLKHKGAQNVMCGPVALYCILRHNHQSFVPVRLNDITDDYIATGISLSQIKKYSDVYHLGMAMARKAPGQAIPTPAVMHLANGHYSAITGQTNGNYFLEDRPMQFQGWVSLQALEAQASGYFLIPSGSLSPGWRAVSDQEGNQIFGRDGLHGGEATGQGATGDSPQTGGDGGCGGMPTYTFFPQIAALRVQDTPAGYRPPVGPAVFPQIAYNDLDDSKPVGPPTFSNVGRIWSINWVAYIDYVAPPYLPNNMLTVHVPGGGVEIYSFDNQTGVFGPNDRSFATVAALGSNTFTRILPDGSQEVYNTPDNAAAPNEIFLTQSIDPMGNALTFTYDSNMRLVAVTDAIGQVTTLEHKWPGDIWKVTKITDPFGRFATFSYNGNSNELSSITDVIGLTSTFTYDTNEFPTSMTTPYGTTTFANTRSVTPLTSYDYALTATDPEGNQEKVHYIEPIDVPPLGPPLPTSINVGGTNVSFIAEDARLAFRNSFYWNKLAMKQGPNDFSVARNYRWLTDQYYLITPIVEATKEALENRVWFNYPGQVGGPDYASYPYYSGQGGRPEKTLRMLSDGTPQLTQTYYNSLGHFTTVVDPVGRTTIYNYASNQIDLIEVRQKTGSASSDRLALLTYNSQHLPLTMVDAASQTYRATYNARGQLLTFTDPLGEITALSYDTNGYLLSIDGPLPGTNDVTSFSYDGFGRVRTLTRPDGYTLTFDYDAMDRVTLVTHPDGTFEQFAYDRLDRTIDRDRLGRQTHYTYNSLRQLTQLEDPLNRITRLGWCACGSLTSITDPLGRTTSSQYDFEKRVTGKLYADGSKITYNYDTAASRVKAVVDEHGQIRAYDYNADDSLRSVSYANALVATPTATFTYDPNYPWLISLQDGAGTTTWSFYPAGGLGGLRVAGIAGPWANSTVTYQYDALGRQTSRSINGVTQNWTYDVLNRPTNVVNALGSFSYGYDGAMPRVLDAYYPNGQKTHYDYFGNAGDHRLQRITDLAPDSFLLSRFTYAYNPIGSISNWIQEIGAVSNVWSLAYDAADQLVSVLQNQGGPNSVAYSYSYDLAGNRTAENSNSVSRVFNYNALNQLVSDAGSAPDTAAYEWDAEERLTAITRGTARSELGYDGLDRRVSVTEKVNGSVVSDRRYLWCGSDLCEERDATGAVVRKRYLDQGLRAESGSDVPAGSYLFTRDHLNSVRTMTDLGGTLHAAYIYSPYGLRVRAAGDLDSEMGFTGHFQHLPSGLALPLYRTYDASLGRWLSRDPLGEARSAHLLAYATGGSSAVQRITDGYQPGFQPIGLTVGSYGTHTGLAAFGKRSYVVGVGGLAVRNPLRLGVNQANPYNYAENDPIDSLDAFGLLPSSIGGAAASAIGYTVWAQFSANSAFATAEATAIANGWSSATAWSAYASSFTGTYAGAAGIPGAIGLGSVLTAAASAAAASYVFVTASSAFNNCGD
jgi:RHS repeat-associated protein